MSSSFSFYRVDTLFIATPPDIYAYVGIGSGGASGVEQEQARTQMQGEEADFYNPLGFNIVKTTFVSELWSGVERLITEGKVGGAGLSDLNPPTFFNIYEAAEIKPTSVQVTS